jgi:hypothetical protein
MAVVVEAEARPPPTACSTMLKRSLGMGQYMRYIDEIPFSDAANVHTMR